MKLTAPFPYFGGKSSVAKIVWERLGNVPNYVEPFFGSGAVLLARPHEPKIETVNDIDAYLTNFWRAVQRDPDGVAKWADSMVNELDLHAKNYWLMKQDISRMREDPDYYDVKIAGWWVWGINCWIGSGWCKVIRYTRPHLGDIGRGIHSKSRREQLYDYMRELAKRMRYVRVCCGDWKRVLTNVVTIRNGLTGVFLDPPYASEERDTIYNFDSRNLAKEVEKWAIENGDNPLFRIALCGYEGDYNMPESWEVYAWETKGGYGNIKKNGINENKNKERIWFSPRCLNPLW